MILTALLDKARRRVFTQLLLDKGALATTIGLGGTVLLLLAGTAILEWYWVALLAIGSLGFGIYQMRKNVPSEYQLAQRIDRRLELADTLSTATYFGANPRLGYEAVCEVQRREAESKARGVDLQVALPLQRSRYIYPAAAMLLAATGLFILRFAVFGTLDLRPSLIEMAVDSFFLTPAEQQAKLKATRADLRPQAFDPTQPNLPPSPDDPTTNIPPESKDGSELLQGDSQEKSDGKGEKEKGLDNGDQKGDDSGDKKTDAKDQKGDKQGDSKDGQDSSQNQDQRSMLDKLRDAVENLMNKMGSKPGEKNNAKSDGKQQKGQQKGDKGQKGDEKGERAEGEPQADSGEQGEQGDPQDSKSAQAPGQKKGEDAASGAGNNDGEKAIKDAEMLKAMGKLSELIGQRANEVTGQVMIEVGNTKQSLRTAFTQQQAGHGEAGSEIHRDEVPLMYQQFVERYFEEVRKGTEGPVKATPAPAGK